MQMQWGPLEWFGLAEPRRPFGLVFGRERGVGLQTLHAKAPVPADDSVEY
jgi:hypothetical protein